MVPYYVRTFWTVHGRETERGEASDPMSRLLYSSPLAFGPGSEQHLQQQAESRSLTSNYSMMETSSFDDRPRKIPRLFSELKDLPVLREVVLKDITNEAMESLKTVVSPNFAAEEEVNSGWQYFLQEQS